MALRRSLFLAIILLTPLVIGAGCWPFGGDETDPTPEADTPIVRPTATPWPTATPRPTIAPPTPNPCPPVGSKGGPLPAPLYPTTNLSVSGITIYGLECYGGYLNVAYREEGPSYNTWEETDGVAFQTMHPLHNMLIRHRTWGDENDFQNHTFFELHPDLANSWESSDDGTQYTFDLNHGIVWSDGTPLTCNDVKWSFDTIRTGTNLQRSPRSVHFNAVRDIVCIDDFRVVFDFWWPQLSLIEAIGLPQHIIRPAHIYEGTDLTLLREEIPAVTSGPFRIVRFTPNEHYVFERNNDYWDQPFPFLDGINLIRLSRAAELAALQSGRIDIGSPQGYNGAEAGEILNECSELICQIWPTVVANSLSPALFLNQRRPPWNDPAVIDAIALAIDNQKYITSVHADTYSLPMGCGFFSYSRWAMPQDRCAQIPGYADVFSNTYEERILTADADKARARAILREAGYWSDETDSSNLVLRLSLAEQNEPGGQVIAQDLREIGIQVELEPSDIETTLEKWSQGDFDAGVQDFSLISIDPQLVLYDIFHSDSERNFGGYDSEEFESLFNRMKQTLDYFERRELAWDAIELALLRSGTIIVAHESYMPVFNTRVKGLMPSISYLAAYGPQNRYDHTWLAR